jgi:hypothetical protein
MVDIEEFIPEFVIQRSLGFKTSVIIIGALLLLISSYARRDYPIIWIIPFLSGALIEWLIVATVYVEINRIQEEIERAKNDIFSFISDSQGAGPRRSIEDRVSELENTVGIGFGGSRNALKERVNKLEREVESIQDDLGRRRF